MVAPQVLCSTNMKKAIKTVFMVIGLEKRDKNGKKDVVFVSK